MVETQQDTVSVLLVDDDARIRESVPRMLASWGHSVVAVFSSADALIAAVVRHQPDVVLMDLDMPGRSAVEAISDLRYRGSKASVIVLSALDDPRWVKMSMDAGAKGYIVKTDGPLAIHIGISTVRSGRRYLSPSLIEQGLGGLIGRGAQDA